MHKDQPASTSLLVLKMCASIARQWLLLVILKELLESEVFLLIGLAK